MVTVGRASRGSDADETGIERVVVEAEDGAWRRRGCGGRKRERREGWRWGPGEEGLGGLVWFAVGLRWVTDAKIVVGCPQRARRVAAQPGPTLGVRAGLWLAAGLIADVR